MQCLMPTLKKNKQTKKKKHKKHFKHAGIENFRGSGEDNKA